MPLDVIGSGFGRTGTLSLKLALEQLGFGPCHHMEVVLADPAQVPLWQAVAAGEPVAMDTLYAGYRSQVDWPGAHVWRQAAAAYPHAKVIHSVRPDDAWWTSFTATIAQMMDAADTAPMPPHITAMMRVGREIVGPQTFGTWPASREVALAAFHRREAEVRETIPAERLLVFDVAEGWGPLCRFLGVPVPDAPFPRANSTAAFWEKVKGPQHQQG